MAGSVPIRAAYFVMLTACGALCQERQEKASSLPNAPVVHASAQANINGSAQFGNFGFNQEKADQSGSRNFFTRRLYPTLPKRKLNYYPPNDGLASGATYAASRTLITRDDVGKAKAEYFISAANVDFGGQGHGLDSISPQPISPHEANLRLLRIERNSEVLEKLEASPPSVSSSVVERVL
jgi:hypothetical protein